MPLQKSYLSFECKEQFGIINSGTSNVILDNNGEYAFVPALNQIKIYNMVTGNVFCVLDLNDNYSIVTSLVLCQLNTYIIAGYEDGKIVVWDYIHKKDINMFEGHNSKVTCLTLNSDESQLASGSNDTDIVVWDLIQNKGLFRLIGHHKPITKVKFIKLDKNKYIKNNNNDNNDNNEMNNNIINHEMDEMLISSSQDTSLKLWELQTQSCVQTLIGHKNEVWTFDVDKENEYLISAGIDQDIYVWKIHSANNTTTNNDDDDDVEIVVSNISLICIKFIGSVNFGVSISKHSRVINLCYNERNDIVFAQVNSNLIQLFHVRDQKELKTRLKNKFQKLKATDPDITKQDVHIEGNDYLIPLKPIRTSHTLSNIFLSKSIISLINKNTKTEHKDNNVNDNDNKMDEDKDDDDIPNEYNDLSSLNDIKSQLIKTFDKNVLKDVVLQPILLGFNNNMLSMLYVTIPNKINLNKAKTETVQNYYEMNRIMYEGHHEPIRSIQFSYDDTMIATISSNHVKVWNSKTLKCIRSITLNNEYGYKLLFCPGNKHVIIGTKKGSLMIYDLNLNKIIFNTSGHSGTIYDIQLNSKKNGIETCAADNCIKFWEFDLKLIDNKKNFTLKLKKTVKCEDEVLCIKSSKDGKYFAAGLLNNTVQIFFYKTMEYYLTLYGHKFPISCMDINDNCDIIVSGSFDKNIKIWGLKHGDCHKSIFAHDNVITSVKFIKNTNYFITTSRDKKVKYWDASKFKKIQEFKSIHYKEILCCDINSTGQVVITAGMDKNIKMFVETSEPIFVLSNEQNELNDIFDKQILDKMNKNENSKIGKIVGSGMDDSKIQSKKATIKTMNIMKQSEYLMDQLQLCNDEMKKRKKDGKHYEKPIYFSGFKNIELYLLDIIVHIPTGNLDEVLLMIPFKEIKSLLYYFKYYLKEKKEIEKIIKCVLYLINIYHTELKVGMTSDTELKHIMKELKILCKNRLNEYRQQMGYNIQCMNYIKDVIHNKSKFIFDSYRWKSAKINESSLYQTIKAQNILQDNMDDSNDESNDDQQMKDEQKSETLMEEAFLNDDNNESDNDIDLMQNNPFLDA